MNSRCLTLLVATLCLSSQQLLAQSTWQDGLKTHFPARHEASSRLSGIQEDTPARCTGFDWNEGQAQWDTTSQTTFTYTPAGDLVERTTSTYSSGTFTQATRQTHAYDLAGYDTLLVAEEWNGAAWVPSYRFSRRYDFMGNLAQSLGYVWNGTTWDTSSGYRATYTYHSSSQVETETQEDYTVGSGWNPSYRVEYSFDHLDRWDTVTGYIAGQTSWEPASRLVDIGWHDYARLLPDSGRFENFSTSWQDQQRFHVTYSQYDSQVWTYETFSGGWTPSDRFIFHYDQHGSEVLSEAYNWVGVWFQYEGLLTHPTYDSSLKKTELWTELFDGYIYRRHERQVYEDFFLGAAQGMAGLGTVTVFPNPVTTAQEVLSFGFSLAPSGPVLIQLYDLHGRLRAETAARGGAIIHFPLSATLENGIYAFHVSSKAGTIQGKVVVQR